MNNNQRGFRNLNQGRNFGNAPQQEQPMQQGFQGNGYNQGYNNREEEPVVAWLNLMVEGANGEHKKLGKGIPLRDSNPLESAILDLLFDVDGKRNDVDANELLNALHLDVRESGKTDDVFQIALPKFSVKAKEAEPVETDEVEQAPAPKATPATTKRTRINTSNAG